MSNNGDEVSTDFKSKFLSVAEDQPHTRWSKQTYESN